MTESTERVVIGTIDAGGVYCSLAAAAGGFAFLTGNPVSETGKLPDSARPQRPYENSPSAIVRAQTRYVFEKFREELPKIGSSILDIVQLEQYVKLKIQSEGYFQVALSQEFMGSARPNGATAQVGSYIPEEAAFTVTGLALIPDPSTGFVKNYPGEADLLLGNPKARFSEMVAVGPYVFTTYFPADMSIGIHPAVRTEDWIWRGNEMQAEAKFGVESLQKKVELAGASLEDVINYTLFVQDVGDLYDFDLIFGEALGAAAPSRTVIPIRGTALPRREGAAGHSEGAPRMEVQFRFRRPGFGAEKVIVGGPGLGYESAGVSCGPLLWVSSQYADADQAGKDAANEVENIFQKISSICEAGGTDIQNILRLRAVVTREEDVPAVYAGLKKAVPQNPPSVCVVVAPAPLPVTDSSVSLDAVVYTGHS